MIKKFSSKFGFLIFALVQIFIGFCIYFQLAMPQDHYNYSINGAKIKTKLEDIVNQCGSNSWVSWLIVDGNRATGRYNFQDVIGCKKAKEEQDCSFSVKDAKLNPFYDQDYHVIDLLTYKMLAAMNNGEAAYYGDVKQLKKFLSIKEILESTNHKVISAGFSIVKNTQNNLVHVFILSKTEGASDSCDQTTTTQLLEELSLYARGFL